MYNSELFILHPLSSFFFFRSLHSDKSASNVHTVRRTFVAVAEGKQADLRAYVTQSLNGFIIPRYVLRFFFNLGNRPGNVLLF